MIAGTPAAPIPAGRSPLRGLSGFALATAALTAAAGLGLGFVFRGEGDARAVWISAAVAFVSQVGAFPAVRRLSRNSIFIGWGAGSLVRFATLAVYALAAGLWLGHPLTPALLSLALFYFLSMVIEPLFLRS
jgi:hypothetical protein